MSQANIVLSVCGRIKKILYEVYDIESLVFKESVSIIEVSHIRTYSRKNEYAVEYKHYTKMNEGHLQISKIKYLVYHVF